MPAALTVRCAACGAVEVLLPESPEPSPRCPGCGAARPRPAAPVYRVLEFWGAGDPYFGGSADDRPLGRAGAFLTGSYHQDDIAEFADRESARATAERAPNRRARGKLCVYVAAVGQ